VSSFEQKSLLGSLEWRVGKGGVGGGGCSKNIFFIIVTFLWKSLTPPASPPPPPLPDVFHNSTKGRLSFSHMSLQSMHSPTRLHATEGKRFEIPFVCTLVLVSLSCKSKVNRPVGRVQIPTVYSDPNSCT